MEEKIIKIKGAKEHNLKNVNLEIPKNKLIVFTGVSGSGKSSLAFNTIYSEGRRRYIESLSTYARQFLGTHEKSNVELIEGLSPSISIDQKSINNNPRSTVGTTTEIFDYLRLLYARIGKIKCINGHGEIKGITLNEILEIINQKIKSKTKIFILSPIIKDQKILYDEVINKIKKNGFSRIRLNNKIISVDSKIKIIENSLNSIDIIVDRLTLEKDDSETNSRLYEAIEISSKYSDGLIKIINTETEEEILFSQKNSCIKCNYSLPNVEPKLFSFNSPNGACLSCNGIGKKLEVDVNLLIPNKSLSIVEGAIHYLRSAMESNSIEWQKLMILLNHYKIPINLEISKLSEKQLNTILYGSNDPIKYSIKVNNSEYQKFEYIEGVSELIQRRYVETKSDRQREIYKKYMNDNLCNKCNGKRLNNKSLSVFINNKNIIEVTDLSLEDSLKFIRNLKLTKKENQIAKLILIEILNRLIFLNNVGLEYLSLSRKSSTLSGGEAQRIRLATQIGSKLSGVLYVLDEPSIGLHQSDNNKLIKTLKELRDIYNTVIVVEHDEDTIKNADWLVDIGPDAGNYGGEIIYNGPPNEINKIDNSWTGKYLSGIKKIEIPKNRRLGNGKFIEIIEAEENNLKKINVKIPLNKFICITGVSGSGKSTLVNEILYKYIHNYFNYSVDKIGKVKTILGLENIDKIIRVSQSPIGKTPRSNPATYTSVFDDIRDLYASTHQAKISGYQKGRFSFNVQGGRCEKCWGDGLLKISMHFLPDVYITCEECKGKRYNNDTLSVKYKNKNIFDILNLTVDEAYKFFDKQIKIKNKLKIIKDVGLGYIKLGQPATQLSGGEAQRVKLATYLQKKPTGKTLFLLDEPTTGLHIHDVKKLLKSLNHIVDNGDTVIVIEHNLDVIKTSDYIIDLGPLGGNKGGKIIATGTPEELMKNSKSLTGKFIKEKINNDNNILKKNNNE